MGRPRDAPATAGSGGGAPRPAHVVEQPRAIFFVLYALSIFATVAGGLVGVALWRLAAFALPAASILAYGYFAAVAHEADVIGLLVKVAELAAIAAALIPVLRPRPGRGRLTVS